MIDINCDMGELNELMDDGTYESLMDHVTSINVACGGHAGDDVMMNTMVKLASLTMVFIITSSPAWPPQATLIEVTWSIRDSYVPSSISSFNSPISQFISIIV